MRGKVLPIGGIKEKVLAAHRAGIRRHPAAPERARPGEDVPAELRRDDAIIFVDTAEEVIPRALGDGAVQATPVLAGAGPTPISQRVDGTERRSAKAAKKQEQRKPSEDQNDEYGTGVDRRSDRYCL